MKKLKFLFSIFFGIILFVSCVPEVDEYGNLLHGVGNGTIPGGSGSGGTGTGGSGTKVLSKFNTFDDKGATFSYSFTYSNKQLTKVTTSDNSYASDITYSNGKISKVVSVVHEAGATESTTITSNVTYDTSGKISKVIATEVLSMNGTVINTTDKVSTYVYNSSNQVTKVTQDYSIAGMQTQTGIFDYSYTGNNLSKMVFTTKMSLGPIPYVVVTTTYSNYDSKISPFSTLGTNYNYFSLSELGLGFFGSPNNFTKITVTESMMGTNTTESATYTYDSQGYANSMTVTGEKSTFEYINL